MSSNWFNRFGIRPLGNALVHGSKTSLRSSGLGSLCRIPDEILLQIFAQLEPNDLISAQSVSQMFFAWCAAVEGFWKVALLQKSKGYLPSWKGTWRRTYLFWAYDKKIHCYDTLPSDSIRLSGIYSDVIYLPYRCAAFQPSSVFYRTQEKPDGDAFARKKRKTFKQNIQCIYATDMDPSKLPISPVILTGLMHSWNAIASTDKSKQNGWNIETLKYRYPNVKFQAESAQITLDRYTEYMAACENDESPIYLFDADFVEKSSLTYQRTENKTKHNGNNGDSGMGNDYTVPKVFGKDLLDYMDEDMRPDFRWLIIGPARSGSTWHQDPNGTSAWNAVIEGEKGWIAFPPEVTPPGVFVSEDRAQVQSPLSVAEWLQSYYDAANEEYGPDAKNTYKRGTMRQGVCSKGEIFYIPSGWWHLVVNLSDSIAITQNFVSEREIGSVLHFMKERPDQVSGFGRGNRRRRRLENTMLADLTDRSKADNHEDNECEESQLGVFAQFCDVLKLHCPNIFDLAMCHEQLQQSTPKSLWNKLTEENVTSTEETNVTTNNFKFSFHV